MPVHPRDRRRSARQRDHRFGRGDNAATRIVGRELERAVAALQPAQDPGGAAVAAAHRPLGLDRQRGRVGLVAVAAAKREDAGARALVHHPGQAGAAPAVAARDAGGAQREDRNSGRGDVVTRAAATPQQDVPAAGAARGAQEADRGGRDALAQRPQRQERERVVEGIAAVAPARVVAPHRDAKVQGPRAARAPAVGGGEAEDDLRRLTGAGDVAARAAPQRRCPGPRPATGQNSRSAHGNEGVGGGPVAPVHVSREPARARARAGAVGRRGWERSEGEGGYQQGQDASHGRVTSSGIQVMCRRERKRSSARTSAGPKARQKATFPMACATLNGNDVALIARYWSSVCSPENVVNVDRSRIAPKSRPIAPQNRASGTRATRRPVAAPRAAPSRPARPQAAICHGVHGPWPKTTFDASAPVAPTANPGAPPSTNPVSTTMSVVGLTFGSGANAIRPSAASPAIVATMATSRAVGFVRSYQA